MPLFGNRVFEDVIKAYLNYTDIRIEIRTRMGPKSTDNLPVTDKKGHTETQKRR